ncbi:MAG: conserved membrane protein of unknown function [Promethearchaeota archaeon]|nr:MAG: conserved membrane protein of unknown function [Candidatus Lokiarchaeota archaeon]
MIYSYTPYDFRVFPIFIYYIILSIFSIFMTYKMYQKWKERSLNPPLYLSIVFFTLTLALLVLTIGMLEAIITGFYREIYRFSLPFSYSMIIIADILLYRFAINITFRESKFMIPLIIVGAIIIFLLFLPWNFWGVPQEDYEGQFSIRLYSTLALILFSYAIYIYNIKIVSGAKKAAEDKVAKAGLSMFMYSLICMIFFFLMFILDTLMIVLFNHDGYSIFVYVAWIFGIAFYILSYLSLVMPDKLKKLILEKKEE